MVHNFFFFFFFVNILRMLSEYKRYHFILPVIEDLTFVSLKESKIGGIQPHVRLFKYFSSFFSSFKIWISFHSEGLTEGSKMREFSNVPTGWQETRKFSLGHNKMILIVFTECKKQWCVDIYTYIHLNVFVYRCVYACLV